MGLAIITLVGRLTRDPETKEIPNTSVTTFSLAVNGRKGKEKTVSFFECQSFGNGGKTIAEWCSKGSELSVSGTIVIEKWQDKDGNTRSAPKVTVKEFGFIGGKQEGQAKPQVESEGETQDDIPF